MTFQHGLLSSYTNHRCRCRECRQANREYMAQYRLTHSDVKPPPVDARFVVRRTSGFSLNPAVANNNTSAKRERVAFTVLDSLALYRSYGEFSGSLANPYTITAAEREANLLAGTLNRDHEQRMADLRDAA